MLYLLQRDISDIMLFRFETLPVLVLQYMYILKIKKITAAHKNSKEYYLNCSNQNFVLNL